MKIKLCVGLIGLALTSVTAFADDTQGCNDDQIKRCNFACESHQNMQSCVIDMTKMDGVCTCNDGKQFIRSKQ